MNPLRLSLILPLLAALGVFIALSSQADWNSASSNPGTAKKEKPLVFVFQKQKDPSQLKDAAESVGAFLSQELGREVRVKVPSDYSASVQALVSGTADFAYTSSLPFLLARRDGEAKLLLAEERLDPKGQARTEYDALIVTSKDSSLEGIQSLKERASEMRVAFTSPTSTSGYIFAHKRFLEEGILESGETPKEVFKSARFAGSYTAALEEVVAGRADVAAVSYYTIEGPKAGKYLDSKKLEKLRVLARTPGVPTHVVVASGKLDIDVQSQVKEALLKLGKTRPELLEDVYGTARFKEVEENEHVLATVKAVAGLGLPLDNLM